MIALRIMLFKNAVFSLSSWGPVEITVTIRSTFEKPAYSLCASVNHLKNAMPSPVEKGDRGAVDKDYPGIKENETNEKSAFLK